MTRSLAAQWLGYAVYMIREYADRLTGEPSVEPLTGIAFIGEQLRELLIMAACGACAAFMFQVYNNCVRKRPQTRGARAVVFVTDLIFCILTGVVTAQFWFRSSYGRLSLHEALGLAAGFAAGIHTFTFEKSKRGHTIAVIYVILILSAYIAYNR